MDHLFLLVLAGHLLGETSSPGQIGTRRGSCTSADPDSGLRDVQIHDDRGVVRGPQRRHGVRTIVELFAGDVARTLNRVQAVIRV